MICNDCVHLWVMRISGGCNEEEVDFACSVLQWILGERFSEEEASEDCWHLGEFRRWRSVLPYRVIFALLGPGQRQHWVLTRREEYQCLRLNFIVEVKANIWRGDCCIFGAWRRISLVFLASCIP